MRVAAGILIAGTLLTGCGGWLVDAGAGSCTVAKAKEPQCLPWAGFARSDGLRVIAIDREVGREITVEFAAEGSADDIDRALDAAGFHESFSAGDGEIQGPTLPVDLGGLTEVESARADDEWINPVGDWVYRQVLRGTSPGSPGTQVLYVLAFTV